MVVKKQGYEAAILCSRVNKLVRRRKMHKRNDKSRVSRQQYKLLVRQVKLKKRSYF